MLRLVFLLASPLSVAAVGRVVPILHANHFDDLMRDTRSGRPPSVTAKGYFGAVKAFFRTKIMQKTSARFASQVLALYDSTDSQCAAAWAQEQNSIDGFASASSFGGRHGDDLPVRSLLFAGRHDRAWMEDVWWHHSPIKPHPDLAARLGALRASAIDHGDDGDGDSAVVFNGTLETAMAVHEARALPMVACPMLAFVPSPPEYAGINGDPNELLPLQAAFHPWELPSSSSSSASNAHHDYLWWRGKPNAPSSWQQWLANKLAKPYALKNDLVIPLVARIDPTLSRSAIGGKLPLGDDDGNSSGSSSKSVVTLAPGASAVIRATPGALIVVQKEAETATTWRLLARPSAPGDDAASLSRRAGFDYVALRSASAGDDSSSSQACSKGELPAVAYLLSQALLDGSREALQVDESSALARSYHLNRRDQDTTFSHSSALRQPKVMPTVPSHGPLGYSIAEMPFNLKEALWRFYDHFGATSRAPEGYSHESTGINAHEVPTTLVFFDLDMRERDRVAREFVQPLVEEWAEQELEFTSLYGIREYYRGSELRMHVDRVATHVFSVIMNLHQVNVTTPWLLEVVTFDGVRREVALQPGQMLFYESAKLVHGRPKPFEGDLYVNAFCHFKPTVGWNYANAPGDVLTLDNEPIIRYAVD